MKRSKRILSLPTNQKVAEYWDTHRLADQIEGNSEGTIRFVERLKQAISIRLGPEDIAKLKYIADEKV